MMKSLSELHEQIQHEVKTIQTHEKILLELLEELDQRKGFLDLGFASLYEYLTKGLKLTEGQACALIAVERRAAQVPALKEALRSGKLSVSKAKRITRVIHPGNAEGWIEKAATFSQKDLELEMARAAPQVFVSERSERMSDKIYRLTIALKSETFEKFKTAKDLLEMDSLESTLEEVLTFFLERKDPLIKAKRIQEKKTEKTTETAELKTSPVKKHSLRNARRPLPAHLQQQLQLRDNGHCQHRSPDGTLCGARRYLHIHHRVPIAEGGSNRLDNVNLFCSSHHRLHHYQEEGRRGAQTKESA